MDTAPLTTGVYDPDLYQRLVQVEEKHFWFRARNRAIDAVFAQIRPRLAPRYRLLEVGCGTGNVLRMLKEAAAGSGSVFGMDVWIDGLRYAKSRVEPSLLVAADAARPPFASKFEVIGAFDVIEHLDDDVQLLKQMHDMLQQGGFLLLTVPSNPRLWSYFDVAAHHRRRYTAAELRSKLVGAGYEVEYLTPFMAVLEPVLWAGRRLMAFRGHGRSETELVGADLRVRPALGAVLSVPLRLELEFIKRRRRLPRGTSLLALARRA